MVHMVIGEAIYALGRAAFIILFVMAGLWLMTLGDVIAGLFGLAFILAACILWKKE